MTPEGVCLNTKNTTCHPCHVFSPLARALGSQALKALLQWLVVLAVFQASLDGQPHLLQKVFHRVGHAPRSRRGHQTHAGNACDLGTPTGLAVHQWAAHHCLGIHTFKPSQETWKHHFLGIAMLQRPREKNPTHICRFLGKVAQKILKVSVHDSWG